MQIKTRFKKIVLLLCTFIFAFCAFAQKPSKEQMEANKKAYAEAQKKLNDKLNSMSPEARRGYDSMMNAMGMGAKIETVNNQVNNNTAIPPANKTAWNGIVPDKNSKKIAAIVTTPSTAGIGAYITNINGSTFSAVLPGAGKKAKEIFYALKEKMATADEMGNAAAMLWMQGKTQIALALLAEVCKNDPANTDNLNNYAAMLTMSGAADLAIPILNNLNGRFKKNSTILNNLGQAWFALGDMDKAVKYLDSTLLLAPFHAQANETRCLIDQGKGNKTAAVAHARAAFKQGNTSARKDKLQQLGYRPGADDYLGFPKNNTSDDLLNLGNFSPMEFPKSYAAMKIYVEQRKVFLANIDQASKPLKKISEESNKQMTRQLEEMQKQFMDAKNKTLSNPGSVSQSSAMQIVRPPMFAEKMNAKEKMVLENLQRRKNEVLQKMNAFTKGDGADYKKKYDEAIKKINEKWRNVGEGGTENNEALCNESVKAVDTYLNAYNTKAEELYGEYMEIQKQLLNEMAYLFLYTTYPELIPGINAGLKLQWLNDLSFKPELLGVSYGCSGEGKNKEGRLTEFKDPNCNINSEFNVGLGSFGGSIKLNCSGMTTTFNAGAIGVTMNQDLDHAGFGDSFRNCTVSIGPKVSAGGKIGPLEANVSAGAGADIEIDRNGISDVVIKGGVEAEAGIGPATASAGAEGRMSLNTGSGSLNGTGIFK